MKRFLLALLTFSMMLFALTGCFFTSEEKINLDVSTEEDQYFEVVDYGYSADRPEKNILYVYFVCKVKNISNEMIQSSDVEINLYDKDDNFIGNAGEYALGVMPGDTIPISTITSIEEGIPVRAEVVIQDTRPEKNEKRKAVFTKMSDFEISNVESKKQEPYLNWTGIITNKGNKVCEGLKVVILYKKDGKLVDSECDSNNLTDIKPGETREFKVRDLDPPSSYDSYEVMVKPSFFVGADIKQ